MSSLVKGYFGYWNWSRVFGSCKMNMIKVLFFLIGFRLRNRFIERSRILGNVFFFVFCYSFFKYL